MRTKWVKRVILGLLWMSVSAAWAQTDSLLYQAERLLNWQAYGRAIDAYTHLLAEPGSRLTAAQRAIAQERLAFAYLQVGDNAKAERFYRESLESNSTEDPQRILQYAKTLAGNGKFSEAQQQYERYLQLNEKQSGRRMSPMPMGNADRLSARQDTVRYRLDYLALNSPNEEFSPAFYQDGLVYVSGTKGSSAIEIAGRSGGNRGYLDLYYAPQRNNLKALEVMSADGTMRQNTVPFDRSGREAGVGSDYYTPPTANDSPTLPDFGTSINITAGLGYSSRPLNPEQQFRQTLNTHYPEGPATFSRDGSRIIFIRSEPSVRRSRDSTEGGTKLKLYTARQLNGAWTDVTELPFNSDAYSVGHPTLSRDEQRLYFSSDMPGGSGGMDLYVSRYQNGQWSKPINLGAGINTSGNELFPFVDDGGNLYFATDGRRGLGGLDLFMATMKTDTTAQRVDHLDRPLNSPQNDFGLITDGGRRGGYFTSNRRGSNDIYRFVRESSLFGCRALTLRLYDVQTGQPLDSVRIDVKFRGEGQPSQALTTNPTGFAHLCLEADNEFVFQASRDGFVSTTVGFKTRQLTDDQPSRLEIGLAKPTVFVDTIASEPPVVAEPRALTRSRIRGVVISDRDHQPLNDVTVRLRNECDQSVTTYVTGADGRYAFDLIEGCDYVLTASKLTFGTNTNRIKRLPVKTRPRDLSADLRMLSVGDVVTIDNIYYDLDQFSLRPDATRELDKLVATMRKYPTLMFEIRSHTDSRGDAARNQALSTQRAKAVAGYLTTRGISRRRMSTLGLGESQLVNNCTDGVICTDAEHQRNRRTEFKVVEIK